MKHIPVGAKKFAIVDDADFARLSEFAWRLNGKGYAIRSGKREDGRRTIISMHREVLGLQAGNPVQVDHRDCNILNNQRGNLRLASNIENQRNRPMRRNNTSGFKGVSFHRVTGKYQAQIRINGRVKGLGIYLTAKEAHEVYCLAADLAYGEFANHG